MSVSSTDAETKQAPMTSVLWVRNIIEALGVSGLDGPALSLRAGIKPEVLQVVEAGVLVKEIIHLWELAVEASGNEAIGLLAAQEFKPSALDATGYAMMSSPTLLSAIERAIRYGGAVTSATTGSLQEVDEGYRLEFQIMTGIIDVQRQNHEYIVFGFLKFFRWIVGQELTPVRVEFKHPAPDDLAPYHAAFKCPLEFGAPRVALTVSREDAARPLITANAQMSALHDQAAELRMTQLGRSQTILQVRQLIVQGLPDGEPTREAIAAGLRISSRSLQRQLQDEGTSFHDLLDHIRRDLAERYLGNERIRLADAASLLGFADQSSFTRAVNRWFAAPPSKVRSEFLARHKGY
jgi:AraC-like DNA-binding protein